MFEKHPISPEQGLYAGSILVILSLIYLGIILLRFHWLLGFALARVLLRWGRGSWSFPASKLGAFTGGVVALTVGFILLDVYFSLLPDRVWAFVFLLLLPFVVGVAIHDYKLHTRLNKNGRAKRRGM